MMNRISLAFLTTIYNWSERHMKLITMAMSVLLLAGISAHAFGQDDHAGHDHEVHVEETHEEHDDHEGHDHGEAEEEHADEVTLSEEAIRLFNIRTERAQRRTLTGATTVPARVSFNTEAMAHIGTQVQGRVQEIAVRLGDEVERGQLLLVIDSPELGAAQSGFLQADASADAARINVEAAEELAEVARTAFERAETLRESNSISITDYLEREKAFREADAAVRRAKAERRVAEAARQAAENQLHIYGYRHEDCDDLLASGEVDTRYEIFAPIAGRVIEREATPGEVVDPADEALMVVANLEELWVLGDVPERHVGRVVVGTPARVTVGAFPDRLFEGTVSYIAPQLDPKTRTASVRVVIGSRLSSVEEHGEHDHGDHGHEESQAEHGLKPGMFGQAELSMAAMPGGSAEAVIAVPEEAIQDVEGGPAIFVPVPGEANTFAMRPIRTGPRVGRWVPVISGLNEGEEFVAGQTFILKAELGKEGASHGHAH